MQLPLLFFDASVIQEVSVDQWRQLFDAVEWPASVANIKDSFGHTDVLRALERGEATDELLYAIEVIHTLGTESGRDAIGNALKDQRVPIDSLPRDLSEREFALQLYLAQRSSASLADVLARAQIQAQEVGDHRRYYEFIGKDAAGVRDLADKGAALREDVLKYCRENDLGEHVQIRSFEDDGAYVFHVIRSHHTRKPLAVVPGRDVRATITYRPVHGDMLRYEPAFGRLRIAARASSVVEFYRNTMGRVLFNNESFFIGDAVCNLDVLQKNGAAALADHRVLGVGRVWMTECSIEYGDRNVVNVRSHDCFKQIAEFGLRLTEGRMVQAKLKMEVVGKGMRPVTVTIRVPSRIELTQKRHERLVDEFLTQVGIRGASRHVQVADLWSLHPWRQPLGAWRLLFGNETDVLVQQRVLVPVTLDAVATPEHAGAGSVLEAHPIRTGDFYGVSRVPEVSSRSLSATDVEGLELRPETFRQFLRARYALSGPSNEWEDGDLLDLGDLELGDHGVRLFYAIRKPGKGVGNRMRTLAGLTAAALLVPASLDPGLELATALLGGPLPSRVHLTRVAVQAAGLAPHVPALYTAPENARIIVDTRIGKVWVDHVDITGIKPETHPFKFLRILAERCPSPVAHKEITDALSGARQDGETTARHAKRDARVAIDAALKAAGAMLDEDPFPSAGTGCYKCALHAYVV